MLRIITAATALTVLAACDSEGIDRADVSPISPTEESASADAPSNDGSTADTSQINTDADGSTTESTQSNDNAGNGTADGGQTGSPTGGQISDDAGSATSDGGQTSNDADAGNNNTGSNDSDAGSSDTSSNDSDAGSDNSGAADDGQISDDAGSATSDGGQVSDDAGSATSDGGQVSDDAGSATSDGGQSNDQDNDASDDSADDASDDNSSAGNSNDGPPPSTDAGTFAADAAGTVFQVASLTASSSENICTSLSDQNNFSDTIVGDFILHNNAWRPGRAAPGFEWEQCIFTNTNGAVVGWTYDWGPGVSGIGNDRPSGDFFVRSYPEIIYGTKDEFRTSGNPAETGLPVRVGEMPTFRVDYSYDAPQFGESRIVDASNNPRFPNGTTISGERNVAVESFLYEPDAAGNCTTDIVSRIGGSNHAYEVMVWIDAGAERLPAGPQEFVADLVIRGDDYKVYTKVSDPRYIAFVAQNPRSTGTIYMNDYIDWARENGHLVVERFGALSAPNAIQDDWCMANILVGTEIFWGAGTMNMFDWTITQLR